MGERGGEYLYFVFIKKTKKKKQLKTTWKNRYRVLFAL